MRLGSLSPDLHEALRADWTASAVIPVAQAAHRLEVRIAAHVAPVRAGTGRPSGICALLNMALNLASYFHPRSGMYRVNEGATIATVTDLRRRTSDVMEQAEDGSVVVIQKDNEPRGVYLSYRRYEAMLDRLNKLENLELAQVAVPRKEAVDRGEMGTTSLEDMIAEFAPELLSPEQAGA